MGVQVPCDDVCKMEASGNVCNVHVAGAVVVSAEQERSTVQLCSRILCGDSGAWSLRHCLSAFLRFQFLSRDCVSVIAFTG